jgi:hypothetical protein
VGVEPQEVIPLLDAVGPAGIYILLSRVLTTDEAEIFLRSVESYRI